MDPGMQRNENTEMHIPVINRRLAELELEPCWYAQDLRSRNFYHRTSDGRVIDHLQIDHLQIDH